MKQLVDHTTWNRREHFEYFSTFEEPFFGLVANVPCTAALASARQLGVKFFLYYLYQIVQAVNSVENLRFRIEDGQVYVYDHIHVSATIGRPDHTFGFSFIEYHDDLPAFVRGAQVEMTAVQSSSGLCLSPATARPDVIHFSALPWIHFTGLAHARRFATSDSAPKISVGQVFANGETKFLPVAVHVHHALADGYHVGQFLTELQRRLA